MLRILVLGAAAGGGFPQWNANSEACRRARAGDPAARPRTQSSIAVSADGDHWVLFNAAPDLRQQIEANPALHPRAGLRHSPISAVVLTGADVDAVAGLLHLREGHRFAVHAAERVLGVLAANSIFNVLAADLVARQPIALDQPVTVAGVTVELFAVPGKVALWLEGDAAQLDLAAETGDTVGARIADGAGRQLFYIPGCAGMTPRLARRLAGADLVFFDGTLWTDDEMVRQGVGTKTGRRMGHLSMAGEGGAIAAFRDLGVRRKVFVHINNTNPVLLDDSPERAAVLAAGWEVAHDGMEIRL